MLGPPSHLLVLCFSVTTRILFAAPLSSPPQSQRLLPVPHVAPRGPRLFLNDDATTAHVRQLVANINKKNHKASVGELNQALDLAPSSSSSSSSSSSTPKIFPALSGILRLPLLAHRGGSGKEWWNSLSGACHVSCLAYFPRGIDASPPPLTVTPLTFPFPLFSTSRRSHS